MINTNNKIGGVEVLCIQLKTLKIQKMYNFVHLHSSSSDSKSICGVPIYFVCCPFKIISPFSLNISQEQKASVFPPF